MKELFTLIFSILVISASGQWVGNSTVQYFTDGNVGIGTPTPTRRLEIVGTQADFKVRQSSEDPGWGLYLAQKSDLTGIIECSGHDLQVTSGWNNSLILGAAQFDQYANGKVLFPGGKIGIGTSSPLEKFHVTGRMYLEGTDYYPDGSMKSYFNWRGHSLIFGTREGTYAHNTIELKPGGSTSGALESNFKMFRTPAPNNFDLKIYLTSNGASFFNGGNVGIGTTTPDAKLAVMGDIHAKEVKVDLNVAGPDYVFEKDYDLPSLEELNTYIKVNKHLPEVPSACTMEEKGVNLGEMNMLLLKKVEELTLYVIELKKEVEKLKLDKNK